MVPIYTYGRGVRMVVREFDAFYFGENHRFMASGGAVTLYIIAPSNTGFQSRNHILLHSGLLLPRRICLDLIARNEAHLRCPCYGICPKCLLRGVYLTTKYQHRTGRNCRHSERSEYPGRCVEIPQTPHCYFRKSLFPRPKSDWPLDFARTL